MSWEGDRLHERFTFRRVSWPSMAEGEDFWQIVGGRASLGAFTDIKASGTISYKGTSVPDGGDLVRVYYSFTDSLGERVERVICTCFVELGEESHAGALVEGDADLRGVLAVLADDGPGMPHTVAAGADPVALAAGIATGLGLRVNATASPYRLGSQHVFDPQDSWLDVVNWLLTAADYGSCYPDPMGTVQMHPYVEPTEREPSWWFRDDGRSAMKREVRRSDNRAGTPNSVRYWHEDDSCGIFAEAVNVDPRSAASTTVLGRTVSMREEVEELSGSTAQAKLESLKSAARKKLLDNSTRIEYLEVPCMYVPVEPNDCVGAEVGRSGISFVGGVTSVEVGFDRGAPTTVRMRRLIRPDFEAKVTGEVVWSV